MNSMNKKKNKTKILILLIIVIVAPFAIVLGLYGIGLRALPKNTEPAMITKYPEIIYEALWINFGGNGEIRMEPIGINHILESLMTSDLDKLESLTPVSMGISEFSARLLIWRGKKSSIHKYWHFYNLTCTIWVSRNWTAKEALSSIADWSYFGNNIRGFHQASISYFGKVPKALKIEEIVVLIAILKSPHNLDPWRFPDKLLERSNNLIEKLNYSRKSRFNVKKLEKLPRMVKKIKSEKILSY